MHTVCFGKIRLALGKRGKSACPVANYTRILHQHISTLSTHLVGKVLNHELQDWLNLKHGVGSNTYREIEQSCRNGVTEGWLCQHEAGGVHYGRIFKPGAQLHGFSVDVVDGSMHSKAIFEKTARLCLFWPPAIAGMTAPRPTTFSEYPQARSRKR